MIEELRKNIKKTKGHLYHGENFYGKIGENTLLKDYNGTRLKTGDVVDVDGVTSVVVRDCGNYIMGIKCACDRNGCISGYKVTKIRGYETLKDGERINCIDVAVYPKRKYTKEELKEAENIIGQEISKIEHVSINKRKYEKNMSISTNFNEYIYYVHDDDDQIVGTMYCLCKMTGRKLPNWFNIKDYKMIQEILR